MNSAAGLVLGAGILGPKPSHATDPTCTGHPGPLGTERSGGCPGSASVPPGRIASAPCPPEAEDGSTPRSTPPDSREAASGVAGKRSYSPPDGEESIGRGPRRAVDGSFGGQAMRFFDTAGPANPADHYCLAAIDKRLTSVLPSASDRVYGNGSPHDRPLAAHPLRRDVVPAHPRERLAVRGQDPLPASARRRALRLLHPPPALRQVVLAVALGVLLRAALGARVRGPVRGHGRRARAHRRARALRRGALRLLRLRRHPGDLARALRGLLPYKAPGRAGAQRGPVPRRGTAAHPRAARHRRQAQRAVRVRHGAAHPALPAHRRVRQLRQHGAGPPGAGGLRVLRPRRGLLPQLLRRPEGRDRRGRAASNGCSSPACRPSRWTT